MQKDGSGGSISDDRKSLVEAAAVLSVSTPQASPEAPAAGSKQRWNKVTTRDLSEMLDVSKGSAACLHKKATAKRAELKKEKPATSWFRCAS